MIDVVPQDGAARSLYNNMLTSTLRPSIILTEILVMAHAAAVTAIVPLELPLPIMGILIVALAANLTYQIWRTILLRGRNAVMAIEVSSTDVLSIKTRSGDWLECSVLGDTCVAAFLAIVLLREVASGARRTVVVCTDSLSADEFRRLRVWLRWKQQPLLPGQQPADRRL